MSRHEIPDAVKRAVEAATPGWKWTAGYRALHSVTWKSKKEQVAWYVSRYDGGHGTGFNGAVIRISVGIITGQYAGMSGGCEYTCHESEVKAMAEWIFAGAKGDCPVPLTANHETYKFSVKGMDLWEQHTKRCDRAQGRMYNAPPS